MKRIDIIIPYVLGPDKGLELKFALRSIEKNFQHDNYRVIVVGDRPEWLKEEYNFPFSQVHKQKYRTFTDQLLKLYSLLIEENISTQFIWTYDDVYFTRPVKLSDIRELKAVASFTKYPNHLEKAAAGPNWMGTLQYTMNTVTELGGSNYNYETHLPRLFSRTRILKLIDEHNLLGRPMMLSSLYYNLYYKDKEPLCLFDKNPGIRFLLRSVFDVETLEKHMNRHQFTNNDPRVWNQALKNALSKLFTQKSKYEL